MKARCLISTLLLLAVHSAFTENYYQQTLNSAHELFQSATNAALYAEAAQQYEYLVTEDGVRNGHLFYTLGNSWFMAGDVGRAILNYRRAECYIPSNSDLQHNLHTALEMRTDFIPEKERAPLLNKVLGWHFNTSTRLRWWCFVFCWLIFWGAWFWAGRSSKKEARVVSALSGLLSTLLLASLLTEGLLVQRTVSGVVIAKEILARKGNGDRYAPAFLEPLHSGSEFHRIEDRGAWWHIRLADGQTCWIPSITVETVTLASE